MSRTSPNKVLRKPPYDSDQPEVEQLIADGWSDSKIAKHYNVTKDTVWCRRQRWGLISGVEIKHQSYITDITALWEAGYTPAEIADVLNISLQMVYSKMRQYQIRDVHRLGLDVPSMSAGDLGRYINDDPKEDALVLITYKRQPRYAAVPIDDYQDLKHQLAMAQKEIHNLN